MSASAQDRAFVGRLKLRPLVVFAAVAEAGRIGAAAEALHISQPAVTKAIRELEATLGAPLFRRHARGVALTEEGAILHRHVVPALAHLSHAGAELRAWREGVAGHVRIGVLIAAAPRLLPLAIARLKADHPGILVTVREATNDQLLPALSDGVLDLVVGRLAEGPAPPGLVRQTLYDEPVLIVARTGHPLLARTGLTLADLGEAAWILPPPETALRSEVEDAFRAQGLEPPRSVVESVSVLTNRTLRLETDMIGVLPAQVAEADRALGLLAVLPVPLPTVKRAVGVTRRALDAPSPSIAAMLACLESVAAEISTT
jgi:DNA-binding transcriptional LysR family regulator